MPPTCEVETVREARDAFLARHGFDLDSYTSSHLILHFGRRQIRVPNPGVLQWHDLHHIATGYTPDVIGEAEISLFELRGGCPVPMVRLLCVGAIVCGMVRAPGRMTQAWRRSRGARTLYDGALPYETLLSMTLPDLRAYLRLAEAGSSRGATSKPQTNDLKQHSEGTA